MTGIRQEVAGGVPILSLVGEFGRDQEAALESALRQALGTTGGRVLLDLRGTVHLHYRLAGLLMGVAGVRGRLALVSPNPYVRQILRLAGSLEQEVDEFGSLDEAVGGIAA